MEELSEIVKDLREVEAAVRMEMGRTSYYISKIESLKKKNEELKSSHCRLVEECIHLKEQRDEAVGHLKSITNQWLENDGDVSKTHKTICLADDYLLSIKA